MKLCLGFMTHITHTTGFSPVATRLELGAVSQPWIELHKQLSDVQDRLQRVERGLGQIKNTVDRI
jgi:hypothetical protein